MSTAAHAPFRVLMVGRTGVFMAPVAERLMRLQLAERAIPMNAIRVVSAGVEVCDGKPMEARSADAIVRHGGNPDGYVARTLNRALVDRADMIITARMDVHDEVVEHFPSAESRTFTISEIGHLYSEVAEMAPLAEHPVLLSLRRSAVAVDPDFDLEDEAYDDEQERRLFERIAFSCEWLADVWAAIVPGAGQAAAVRSARSTTVDVDAFGVAVRLVCDGDDPDRLAWAVGLVWSRLVSQDPREPEVTVHVSVLDRHEDRVAARREGHLAYATIDEALHHLTSTVTVRAIDARAGQLVMLHAAAVALPDGRAVGFVAPSGTGKTTLARVLGAHFGYVTDETLAVDFRQRVFPYPKPLSIITDPELGMKEQWSADSLDLLPAPAQVRLTRLVLLERIPGRVGPPRVERIPLLRGLAEVASQVSYLPRLPGKLHDLADLAEAVGGLVRLTYADAADVVGVVPALVAGEQGGGAR